MRRPSCLVFIAVTMAHLKIWYSKAIDDYTGIIRLTNSGINQTLAYSYRAEMFEKLGNKDQALLDRDRVAASL